MERYALFSCPNKAQIIEFQFITLIQIEEWSLFPPKAGNVVFYLAEANDEDKNGKTAPEKLDWLIVGMDMRLKHGKDNVYLLMDQ